MNYLQFLPRKFSSSLAVCFGLVLGLVPAEIHAETVEVDISNFAFNPSTITVQVGDEVVWTNLDAVAHTTTSDTGLWDSGNLNQGETFRMTFSSPGTFPYHCSIHPFMTGSVVVEAAANQPPTVSLTAPADGATFTPSDSITLSAIAGDEDGAVVQVEFFDGESSLGTVADAPYEIRMTFAEGEHNFTAVATDNEGASTTSGAVTVTVQSEQTGMEIENPIEPPITKGNLVIELETIASGMTSPLGMAIPDDGSGRFFVYDQAGMVFVIQDGERLAEPLLNVGDRLVDLGAFGPESFDERGLLGLALHPQFSENPLLYTYTSEPVDGEADFTTPPTPRGRRV